MTKDKIAEKEEKDALKATKQEEKVTKKAKKKSKIKMDPVSKVILIISIIVFIGSGGYLAYKYIGEPILEQLELAAYKKDYDGAKTHSADDGVWEDGEKEEEEERLPNGMLASFKNMIELNSDVVGWITIPNTPIDYPVTQTTDNNYYIRHNINKEYNYSGCPFVDYRNVIKPGELSRCTLIYAHHRRNGTMFAKLTKYNDIEFYKENPVIRFDTVYDRNEWVVFANLRTSTSSKYGKTYQYIRPNIEDDDEFIKFVGELRERSLIDTPVEVTAEDDILLLSTCSYERTGWRMIIAARKLREGETSIDVSSATKAKNPLMPK